MLSYYQFPILQKKGLFLPVISKCWHYLLSVFADAMQNDSPYSSVPLPDNSAGGP